MQLWMVLPALLYTGSSPITAMLPMNCTLNYTQRRTILPVTAMPI
jgi:hypothetical protein